MGIEATFLSFACRASNAAAIPVGAPPPSSPEPGNGGGGGGGGGGGANIDKEELHINESFKYKCKDICTQMNFSFLVCNHGYM